MNIHDYYSNIGKQVCFILKSNTEIPMASLAASITVRILDSNPTFGQKYILEPLTIPFRAVMCKKTVLECHLECHLECQEHQEVQENLKHVNEMDTKDDLQFDLDGNPFFTTEKEMNHCIHGLYILLIQLKLYPSILEHLQKEILGLYYIYQSILNSVCGSESFILDMLIVFFDNVDSSTSCHVLKSLVLQPIHKSPVKIVLGSQGGFGLSLSRHSEELPYTFLTFSTNLNHRMELNPIVFTEFLVKLSKKVISDFFLQLLQVNFDSEQVEFYSSHVNPKQRWIHLSILIGIMHSCGSDVLENPKQVILFIKNILSSGDLDVIPLAITLLSALLETDEYKVYESCHLDLLEIQDSLKNLLNQSLHSPQVDSHVLELYERLQVILKDSKDSKDSKGPSKQVETESAIKMSEAIKCLADPLLPIRAQGLGILRNLILSQDLLAKDRLEWILTIFLEQLDDEDSYIYLFAIKGLSALTDVYPQESLLVILERWMDKNKMYSMDYRLKMGQVILQTIQRMNETFVTYGISFFNPIYIKK